MDFIQTSNKQVDKFGTGKHGFSAGNPTGGILATYLSNLWCDGVQQELINLIEAAGLVPSSADLGQVLKALRKPGTIKNIERFTTNGSWTCPAGITTIWVSGCAGGGGGAGGGGAAGSNVGSGGGGGGAGQSVIRAPLTVVPGTTYTVTIGAGGTRSTASPSGLAAGNASAGGSTSFGALLTLTGGGGGGGGINGASPCPGGPAGSGFPAGGSAQDGFTNGGGHGGMGASGPFGGGGGNGRGGNSGGVAGSAGYGFGSGGGGGGGSYTPGSGNGANGGDGAPGLLVVEW